MNTNDFTTSYATRDGAEAEGTTLDTEYRIVRRYVTEPEEA